MSAFTRYLLIGAGLAVAAALAAWMLRSIVGPAEAYRITVALVALGSMIISFESRKVGLTMACLAWLAGSIVLAAVNPSFVVVCGAYALFLTVVRGMLVHKSLLKTAIDLVLSCFALGAAAWAALHSGSFGLTVWSYMLVTSLVLLSSPSPRSKSSQDFDSAMETANAALRQLTQENAQ